MHNALRQLGMLGTPAAAEDLAISAKRSARDRRRVAFA